MLDRAAVAAGAGAHGYGAVGEEAPPPILFPTGTGSDGSRVFLLGGGAFTAMGRTRCVVSSPRRSTTDLQVSVQHLVLAIRRLSRRAKRPIAVAGISQGGLLIRVALIQDVCPGRQTTQLERRSTP